MTLADLKWTAQISFTGIAEYAGQKTRDWILKVISETKQPLDIDEVARNLVALGQDFMAPIPRKQRILTILIAVVEHDKCPRVLLVSTSSPFVSPRLAQPQDCLTVFSRVPKKPILLVLGARESVIRHDRKLLKKLIRTKATPSEIQEALARVNNRAATSPESRQLISAGCMVSSLLPDGRTYTRNFGSVEGFPETMMGGMNVLDPVRKHLRPTPGKKITFVQSASSRGRGHSLPAPEGAHRIVRFSTPDTSASGIANTFGGQFDKLVLRGLQGQICLRKNEWAHVVFNVVTFEIGPTTLDESGFRLFEWLKVSNVPTVEGAQPGSWDYVFDVSISKKTHTISIHQNSMAFRSANQHRLATILGPTEELLMLAPHNGLLLEASPESPIVSGQIHAAFLLREFLELEP